MGDMTELQDAIDFVENEGKTTMVMRVEVSSLATGREQALGGYGQAFEKLDAYLASQAA